MRWLAIFSFALAAAFGFFYAGRTEKKEERKPFPVTEKKQFAVVIYAHNDLLFYKKALSSLFAQDLESYHLFFVDDGSYDKTAEEVTAFLQENQQEYRATVIRHEERLGEMAALRHVADSLLDREIVLFFHAKDWLASPQSLDALNASFQDPDVWVASFPTLSYPSYEKKEKVPLAFLAGLFKQIPLQDVLDGKESILPLVQMSEKGHHFGSEMPLLFFNETVARKPREERKGAPLKALPVTNSAREKVDLLLFSYNRPLQLYACLESVERLMSGLSTATVLYRASDERFEAGYQKVAERFPQVRFLAQSKDTPKQDFKKLVLKTVQKTPSSYILFGVDDLLVKDQVDLSTCTEALQKTGAYGFFLRFGTHINFSYQTGCPQKVPLLFPVGEKIFAWDLKKGEADWGFPNSLDMTLYRKKDLEQVLKKGNYKTPNSLESIWTNEYAPKEAIGLCFDHSKVLNIPLNVVHKTGNPNMEFATPEELLTWFEEGKRMDIAPFFQIENNSPHAPLVPKFY